MMWNLVSMVALVIASFVNEDTIERRHARGLGLGAAGWLRWALIVLFILNLAVLLARYDGG